MGKLLKWLIGLILVVALLVIAAVIVIPLVVDPNDYKDDIIAQVKQQTGRDLALQDKLELSVFPTLAVQLGGARLSNAEGFGDKPFAEVDKLALKVKLLPLLSKRVEVDTVVLRGLKLNLAKDAEGKSNWDDLVAKGEKPEEQPAEDQPKADKDGEKLAIKVEGVEIEDAQLVWDDKQAGQFYELSGLRLVTGAISPGATVPVELGLSLKQKAPARTVDLELKTQLSADEDFQKLRIEDLLAKLAAAGEGLPKGGVKLELGAAQIAVDQAADTAELSDLTLSGTGIDLAANLNVAGMTGQPKVNGKLVLAESNLRDLLALAGGTPAMADPKALTKVAAQLELAATDKGMTIKPLQLTLDDSKLTGDIELVDFEGPNVNLALNLDQIDIDRYLPPAAAKADKPAEQAKPEATEEGGDPLAALRTLVLNGQISVGKLKASNLTITDIQLGLAGKDGIIKIDPLGLMLYEGKLTGSGNLDATGEAPKVILSQSLQGLKLRPLFKDLGVELPPTADPKVIQTLDLDARIAATNESVALNDLTVKLDDSTMTGRIALPSFTGPAVRFNLALDAIDVDRYLPPPSESDKPEAEGDKPAAGPASDDPLAALRPLDLNGRITVGKLIVNKLKTTDIVLGIQSKDGVLTTKPMAAKLYQGRLKGEAILDARKKEPVIKVKQSLSGIQVGPLLGDMAEFDKLTGRGDVSLDLSMRGLDPNVIKPSLNGSTSLSFKDGTFKGMDVVGTICGLAGGDLGNLLKGGASKTPEVDAEGVTKFSELSASTQITNGVVSNQDLAVKSPLLRVDGKGKVNLPKESLDYLATAKLVSACKGQGGKNSKDLVGVPLPIKVSGAFADPKIKPDWDALIKALGESKAKGALEEKLQKELGGKLPAGLLGGSSAKSSGSGDQKSEKQADPAEQLINQGLKGLFGR